MGLMKDHQLDICKVTPPPGSPTDMCLPLTYFDLIWLRYPPTETLFFYEVPYPEEHISGSVVPKLKHSLSLTLQHYLPVAGNITWSSSSPDPVIRYKEGDGIVLTVVVSDADFHHLSGKSIRECRIFGPLAAHLMGSDSQVPLFAIKITIFPDMGFCVGISTHHGVFDGKTAALFMKSWACISKFGENEKGFGPELTPFFNRENVRKQYEEIESSYIEILRRNGVAQNSLAIREYETVPDRVRGTFEISGLDVKKLKDYARDLVPYASTFTVTFAYIIHCIVRAKRRTNCDRVFVGFPVDIRGRLEPQLPTNYFGNCITFCDAILHRDELLGKDGMTIILNFISKSIKSLEHGVLEKIEQPLLNAFKERNPDDTEATRVYVVGSSRFGFQNVDFGWGKPKKVDISQVDKMSAIVFSELGGGAVEVELSLNKLEMERFSYLLAQGLEDE